jgi:glycosyltransferase involved in cell wall biosynthesis
LAPLIVVHSKFVREIVVAYGATANRVRLIPLPFENSESRIRDCDTGVRVTDPLLVTVGGFAHTKGQHDVVKALPQLIKHFPGIRYQMIGEVRDETYLTYLKKLAARLGITEHLLIRTDVDEDSKLLALTSADVYIQPSHEEGFCLAYAEAAAIVPRLLGSRTGAIAEMSRDDLGARLVPAKSPPAIAKMVVDLLGTTLPTNLLQLRADRFALEFSMDRYLTEHERLYRAGSLPIA